MHKWKNSIITASTVANTYNKSEDYICTKYITYGIQFQHHYNVNRSEGYSLYDCSSEERILFRYISHFPEALGQSLELVQRRHIRRQWLL